ncbi:hypothetical protein LG3211_3666 [Lysobacter gummosus]|nr:hypothetical protein LG3211_3666 [Lysobacter gummosus]
MPAASVAASAVFGWGRLPPTGRRMSLDSQFIHKSEYI